ncbi:hypothetical protein MRX96_003925 [Rhipicephalus microplus]
MRPLRLTVEPQTSPSGAQCDSFGSHRGTLQYTYRSGHFQSAVTVTWQGTSFGAVSDAHHLPPPSIVTPGGSILRFLRRTLELTFFLLRSGTPFFLVLGHLLIARADSKQTSS